MKMEAFTFMKIKMTDASMKVTRYHSERRHKKHTLEECTVALILLNVAFLSARAPPPMFVAQVKGLASLCMFWMTEFIAWLFLPHKWFLHLCLSEQSPERSNKTDLEALKAN
jgi:hypothetical protein